MFFAVTGVREEKQVAYLLTGLGAQTYAVSKNLVAPKIPKDYTIEKVLIEHFKPKPPVIAERFTFHKRDQLPGEPVNEFVIQLRRLARTCNFGVFLDEALRDRLVCSLQNSETQKKLLAESELTLQRAVDIATAAEMAVLEGQQTRTPANNDTDINLMRYNKECQCCGKRGHVSSVCRFRQSICFKCKKRGHLQTVCKSSIKPTITPDKAVKQVIPDAESSFLDQIWKCEGGNTTDDLSVWTISGGVTQGYHVHLKINNKPLRMELDTGAAVSVMSHQQWKIMTNSEPVCPYQDKPLRGYSGHEVEVVGQVDVNVEYQGHQVQLPLLIVEGEHKPALFGRNWLTAVKLDWNMLHQIHSDTAAARIVPNVFQKEVGCIRGYTATIRLKENVKPIFKKNRSVPYALQPALEAELEQMQKEGIIEPTDSSEWATPLVIVPKSNGKIRVCGDFKVTINQCVETKLYPLPNVEDIFARLAGGKIFTKLDLSQAYLQLPVDEDSKGLLVINTPKGLFRYNRIPYGVSVAPAIFQSVMDRVLQGLPVACYLDDILIAAPTEQEHNSILDKVISRLQESGIHLREEKCEISKQQVEYLGHMIDAKGIHPMEDKVHAIHEAPIPQNITQLRAFVGLLNYYSKFIPQVATHVAPLYKLLEKDMKWGWNEECETAFKTCKDLLTSEAVLVHYDARKPIKLACDASSYGLGAVLSHVSKDGEHPIAFVS